MHRVTEKMRGYLYHPLMRLKRIWKMSGFYRFLLKDIAILGKMFVIHSNSPILSIFPQ